MSDISLLRETLSWINSIHLDDHHNHHSSQHHPNHNDRYINKSKIDMMYIDDNHSNRLGYYDVIMNPSNYFYDMKFLKINNINHDNYYYPRLIDKHYWLKRFVYHTLKKSITRQQLYYRIYYYNIDRLQLYVYNFFQYWYHRSKLNNNRTKKMIKNMRRNNYNSIIQSSHSKNIKQQNNHQQHENDHRSHYHLNKVEIILRYNYKLHNYLLFWYFYIKSLKKIKIRYWKLMILIYRGHELIRKVRRLFSLHSIYFNSSKHSPLFQYIYIYQL
jgi:hypothetical protein